MLYTTVLPPNLKDVSSGFCNFYRFNFNRSFFAEQIVSSVPYHVCARSSCLQSRLVCSVPCGHFIWKNRWFISWHFFHQWVFHTHQFSTMLWTTFFVKGTDIAGEINKKIASTISLVIISSLYIYANIFSLYIYTWPCTSQSVERRCRNTEVADSIPNRGFPIFLLTGMVYFHSLRTLFNTTYNSG